MSTKRRGSRVPDDDEDEESEYFRVKPENKVVVLGTQIILFLSPFSISYGSTLHTSRLFPYCYLYDSFQAFHNTHTCVY